MTAIKGPGPMTVQRTEPVAPAEPAVPTQPASPSGVAIDGVEAAVRPAESFASQSPDPTVAAARLAAIGALKQDPLFGAGARCVPLKVGQHLLDDPHVALDAELLAMDLAEELRAALQLDPSEVRRAATEALLGGYPGGDAALRPVTSK